MFPIRGLVLKQFHNYPYIVYEKTEDKSKQEVYDVLGAFSPFPSPDRSEISSLFLKY